MKNVKMNLDILVSYHISLKYLYNCILRDIRFLISMFEMSRYIFRYCIHFDYIFLGVIKYLAQRKNY